MRVPRLTIIPEPKHVAMGEGAVTLGPEYRVYATPAAQVAGARLAGALAQEAPRPLPDDVPAVMVRRAPPTRRIETSSVDRPEGYDLDVTAEGVLIRGADPAGAFYGVQTFLQMVADGPEAPLCHLRDWPDLAVRGVHFDLKGCTPTFEYLKGALIRLAHYKVNTVLMEYEDRLVYPGHPALTAPSALTAEQAAELERLARANFIQLVPLLQCLGHAEYILKHHEYAHLRETEDHSQQLCPLKPKTLEFFKHRAEHLVALHPESVYFHAGGDETWQLGECPACHAAAERIGPYRLYFDYVKACCEYLIANGRRPIIWDDILTRHAHGLLAELPPSTVVMYWLYWITQPTATYCYYGGGTAASETWRRKPYDAAAALPPAVTVPFERMPPEDLAFFRKYAGTEEFPRRLSSTPFLRFMQDCGAGVMGASAIQPSDHGVVADPERGIANLRAFARAIHEARELGMVSTAWTRSHSYTPVNGVMEGMWYPFIASAEWYWSVGGVDERRFDEKLNRRLFGLEGLEATDAIWLVRHRNLAPKPLPELFADLAKRATRNREILRYYGVMAEVLRLGDALREGLGRLHFCHYASRHQALTPRERKRVGDALADRRALIDRLRDQVAEVYAHCLHPHDLQDCLASMFDWPETFLAWQEAVLAGCP